MKKARVFNTLSLLFNLLIVGAAIFPLVNFYLPSFQEGKFGDLLFYDFLAPVILGVIALVMAIINIACLVKGKELPKGIILLKLFGVIGVMMSFVLGMYRLLLATAFSGAAYSLDDLFGNYDIAKPALMFNLVLPILGTISFIFLDRNKTIKVRYFFIGMLLPVLYFGFYLINTGAKLIAVDELYDWYHLFNGEALAFILFAGFILISLVLSILYLLFNSLLGKEKEEEQTASPALETPVAEEVKEEQPAEEKPVEEQPVEEEVKEGEAAPIEETPEEKEEESSEPVEEVAEEEEPAQEEKVEEPVEEVKEEKKPVKKAASKKASSKEEKPIEKKSAPKKASKPAEAPKEEKKPKEGGTKVYHLTKRKEDGKWAITFVGGQKAVKLFNTKKEAEEYLAILTQNQGATALIRNSKGAKAGKFASSIKSDKDEEKK